MNDTLIIFASSAAITAGILSTLALLRHYLAARAWRVQLDAIASCAGNDQLENQKLRLLRTLYRRWPETVRVILDPKDPFMQKVRPSLNAGALPPETLLLIYRSRPAAIQLTLDPKQHKMQICDAQKLGIPITIANPTYVQDPRGVGFRV